MSRRRAVTERRAWKALRATDTRPAGWEGEYLRRRRVWRLAWDARCKRNEDRWLRRVLRESSDSWRPR